MANQEPNWGLTLDSKEESYLKFIEEWERAIDESWRMFFGTLDWAKCVGSYDISKLHSEEFEKRVK